MGHTTTSDETNTLGALLDELDTDGVDDLARYGIGNGLDDLRESDHPDPSDQIRLSWTAYIHAEADMAADEFAAALDLDPTQRRTLGDLLFAAIKHRAPAVAKEHFGITLYAPINPGRGRD